MINKKYVMPESERKKRSETLKKKGGNSTSWKKGQKAWNFQHGTKKKRKFVNVNKKSILNSHFIWCSQPENLNYVPKGFVIHHLNNNSVDDNPNNLIMLPDGFHKSFHNRIAGEDLIK